MNCLSVKVEETEVPEVLLSFFVIRSVLLSRRPTFLNASVNY